MGKLVPLLLAIAGLAIGAGTGLVLRPAESTAEVCVETGHGSNCDAAVEDGHGVETEAEPDPNNVYYVKLSKQFVVPVVKDNKVASLVVMSLSIETTPAVGEVVFQREPKLRDALLGVMFLHANSGGFDGQFTGGEAMRDLRGSLLEAARDVIGDDIYSVLVTDILRQDV